MSPKLFLHFSAESRPADMIPLMHCYAAELRKLQKVMLRCPLYFCRMDTYEIAEGTGWTNPFPEIDRTMDCQLLRAVPLVQRDGDENWRWPFYVNNPLCLTLRVGDQWWQYSFTPGKTYEERSIAVPEVLA